MKRTFLLIGVAVLVLVGGPALAFLNAEPLYREARSAKDPASLRLTKWKIEIMKAEFPLSKEAALKEMAKNLPMVPLETRLAWLESKNTASVVIDGKKRYFVNLIKNFEFRNLGVIRQSLKKMGGGSPFFDQIRDIIFTTPKSGYAPKPWQPYIDPVSYLGEVTIDVPRKELPKTGVVKIWVPLPIQTASQVNPRVVSIAPAKYVRSVPKMDGDFGLVYCEIPMTDLKEDLSLKVSYTFTHYQQRFFIDPAKVLPYDKQRALYKTYTRSRGNTLVTPGIAREAKRVAGKEKNPYLAAKKLYDHVVKNIPYSFVPHATVQMLGIAESVYVFENRHGDCGAQSMFFVAMCRALGIPARSTGGYQIVPGVAGTHFWAEFYLEGYGWIPVDITVAEISDWSGEITEAERTRFKEFFFGNQDPYRYIIQKDVDLPLSPRAEETLMNDNAPLLAVQAPFMVCADCNENPFDIMDRYYKITFTPMDR